jgi:hypothetical protein
MGEEKVSEHKIQTPGSSVGQWLRLTEKLLRGRFPCSLSLGLEKRQPRSLLQPFFSLEEKQRNSAFSSRLASATQQQQQLHQSDTRVNLLANHRCTRWKMTVSSPHPSKTHNKDSGSRHSSDAAGLGTARLQQVVIS